MIDVARVWLYCDSCQKDREHTISINNGSSIRHYELVQECICHENTQRIAINLESSTSIHSYISKQERYI